MQNAFELAEPSPPLAAEQLAQDQDSDFQSDGDDLDNGRGTKRKRPLSVS